MKKILAITSVLVFLLMVACPDPNSIDQQTGQDNKNRPGTLDTSFNSTGYLLLSNISENSAIRDIVITNDSKIIALVETFFKSFLIRCSANGEIDNTFGQVTFPIGMLPTGSAPVVKAIVLQQDGKILVTGSTRLGDDNMFLVRFNSDGTLDMSFGENESGFITIEEAGGNDLLLLPDNKIVVGGFSNLSGYSDAAIWCFDSDGRLATDFATNGIFSHANASGSEDDYDDIIYGLTYDSLGNIYAVGSSDYTNSAGIIVVWKLDEDGNLDSSFNNDGVYVYSEAMQSYANAVYVFQNKLYIAGSIYNYIGNQSCNSAVLCLNSEGLLDKDFASGTGISQSFDFAPNNFNDNFNDIIIDSSGRITAIGEDFRYAIVSRLNSNGNIDRTFANQGQFNAIVPFFSDELATSTAYTIKFMGDKHILVGGQIEDHSDHRIYSVLYKLHY